MGLLGEQVKLRKVHAIRTHAVVAEVERNGCVPLLRDHRAGKGGKKPQFLNPLKPWQITTVLVGVVPARTRLSPRIGGWPSRGRSSHRVRVTTDEGALVSRTVDTAMTRGTGDAASGQPEVQPCLTRSRRVPWPTASTRSKLDFALHQQGTGGALRSASAEAMVPETLRIVGLYRRTRGCREIAQIGRAHG